MFRYELNAKRIAKLAREKPNQPDQALVQWVNFALANGRLPELKPELVNLSFFTYNHLDILCVVFCCLFVGIQLFKQILVFSIGFVFRQRWEKTKMC